MIGRGTKDPLVFQLEFKVGKEMWMLIEPAMAAIGPEVPLQVRAWID